MEIITTPKVENVRMLDRYSRNHSQGTLYLTTTHLIFVDPDAKKETWILHMHIASLEKLQLSTIGSPLLIRCKTFLSVTFVIPKERDCHDIYTTLQQLSQPSNVQDLYCFYYTSSTEDIPKTAGWDFDLQIEYKRMGVPNDRWCPTTLNQDYELCDTYPKHLFVPTSANTTVLMGSSRFRSKGRLPVLSYLHHNKASISRCSQPLSGFSARCLEDEQLLNHVLKTNPNSSFMYVVDTRPKINAFANRAAGKGYENEAFYENIKFHFLGVENIHVMRSSLTKITETCELKNPTMSTFLNGLESSGWLKHIKAILDTSWFIAQAVEEGINVVVHCSDGWDRTAQVCSLASLLLDPHYRTIKGYQTLIEKDWLAFGHKFSERCGHIQGDNKEISPVFTQLLDATWQLMQQFPLTFEFNERFLLTLHDHVMSCQFGTFVGNCEKDRLDLRLNERTFSLWGYTDVHINEYVNPVYLKEETPGILVPNLCPQNIKFWRGMYCRFESGVHPREPLGDLLLATCDHSNSLEDHIKYLAKYNTPTMTATTTVGVSLIASALPSILSSQLNHCFIGHKIASVKSLIMRTSERKSSEVDNANLLDNKYVYEKSNQMENANDNHPLKLQDDEKEKSLNIKEMDDSEAIQEVIKDFESVALDWKTLRNINECNCSAPFDHFSRKYHCHRCGDVFCVRCIEKQVILPGHFTQKSVPVCKPCFEKTLITTE